MHGVVTVSQARSLTCRGAGDPSAAVTSSGLRVRVTGICVVLAVRLVCAAKISADLMTANIPLPPRLLP